MPTIKPLLIKWLGAVLAIPLGLLLIGLTQVGWFGLLSAIALPMAILYTFELGGELRRRPGRASRIAGWILGIPQTLFAIVAASIGISIVVWVLYNLLIERQPEFRAGSIGFVIALLLFGIGWLSRLFRKPRAQTAADSGFWFRSDMFAIEPGEDEETNPGIFGRKLAAWLRERFIEIGYPVEEVIAEDWGWCVMCSREPVLLWIGCGAEGNGDEEAMPLPGNIDWHCFAVAESPPWHALSKARKADKDALKQRLHTELQSVLASEPRIRPIPAP